MRPFSISLKIIAYFVFVWVIILPVTTHAQITALQLSTKTIDFGRIAATVYPAKTIEFENTGSEKLAILLIEKGPNVKVNFQRKFFQPGEKGIISFYYEARNMGDFNEEIQIFNNLDNIPQTITIRGTCISIQECFPNIHNLNMRNVLVINKNTQAPVPFANVTFIHNHNINKPYVLKMDKNGKIVQELPIGLYNINTMVAGFEPYKAEQYIPKTYPNILIELTPKETLTVVSSNPVADVPRPMESGNIKITSIDFPEDKYAANNIVLLLDVSGSMNGEGKFRLLQQSINNLVMILRPIDYITVITYSTESRVVIPGISGIEKEKILSVIESLKPSGSTQGVKGLNTAYELAEKQFIKEGNNQIILATDGEFSEKNVTDEYYQKFISGYYQKGIKLSILGFGVNKAAIERMKKMTVAGNGSYIQIESEKFIKNALINEIKAKSLIEIN